MGGALLQRAISRRDLETEFFTEVSNDMSIAQEEIFGPAAAGMRVEDYGGAWPLPMTPVSVSR